MAIHKPASLLLPKSPIDKYETQYAMQISHVLIPLGYRLRI
jgi:hypothetical protein